MSASSPKNLRSAWILSLLLLAPAALAESAPSQSEAAAKAAEIAKEAEAKAAELAKEAAAKAAEAAKESSSVKTPANPFGLPIAGPVQVGGSDDSSKKFLTGDLPKLAEFVNSKLDGKGAVKDSSVLLNPEKLFLKNTSDVRVYFLGEGSDLLNSIGFTTEPGGIKNGNPELIFPNASSTLPLEKVEGISGVKRSESEPLLPGDFVDLGTLKEGTKLDFFLIAQELRNQNAELSNGSMVNKDAISRVVSYSGVSGSYLLIGFENLLKGGDRDFKDVMIAVDLGSANVASLAALTATPEPATIAILPMFLGLGWWMKRRQDAKTSAKTA